MKGKFLNFLITLCICCCGIICFTACSDKSTGNLNKQVPIYQGISFENQTKVNKTSLITLSDHDDDEDDDIEDKDVSDIIVKDFGTIEIDEIIEHGVKSEKAYLVLNFHNPAKYEILSFVMNGEKYQSYQFNEDSTSEKIKVGITLPDISGVYEYTIQEIKYIDGDDIENCRIEGNTSVKVGVTHDNPPKVITSVNTGYNSVEASTNVIDNSNIILNSKGKVKFYIFNSNSVVYSKELNLGLNTIKFDGLKQNKRYKYVVAAIYDSLDGNGIKTHILDTNFFTTKSYVNLDAIEIGKDNIKICVNKNLEEVSVDSIKLLKDNALIETSKELNVNFTGLLSNSLYKIQINYSKNNKEFTFSKKFTTLSLNNPTVNILVTPSKNSISYVLNVNDTDNVIKKYKINLKKDNKILQTLETLEGNFENILSNTTYQLEVETICDMRDGNAIFSNIQSISTNTLPLTTPSCGLNVIVGKTNITGSLVLNDIDNIFKLKSIELRTFNNNELRSSTTETNINFEINSNVAYVLVVNYSYNLNDGLGEQEGKFEKKIVTNKIEPTIDINVTPTDKGAYFDLVITDVNSVGAVDSIKLYKNDVFLQNISVTENNISNLISNTEYKIRVKYRYDFNDENGAQFIDVEKTFTTLKSLPNVSLERIDLTESSITINPVITDDDSAGAISKIELYNGNKLIGTKTKDYLFEQLLSNNNYTIKCYYTYNLNDGQNQFIVTKDIKTLANTPPAVDLILTSTLNKINYEFISNAYGIIPTFTKIELYKNEINYEESSTKIGEFSNLLSGNEYMLKAIYAYDLNDGNGVITNSITRNINTKIKMVPKISINWSNLIDVLAEGQVNVLGDGVNVNISGIFLYKDNSIIQSIINNSKFSFKVEPNTSYRLYVKYTYDLNNGLGLQECEENFEFTTTRQIPTASIVISNIDTNSVDYNLYFNDVNNSGAIKGIKIYQGGIHIKQLNEFDTHVDNLEGNTEYKFVVNYLYDLGDGLGSKSLTYEKIFKTLKAMPVYNMSLSKDGNNINLQHNLIDPDGAATFKNVKLYSSSNKLVTESNNIQDTKFTNLLNGNNYRVVVSFDYDLNNGVFLQEYSDVIYIDSLTQPFVNITSTVGKKDLNFDYNYIDNDNVVRGTDVNLYKGSELVKIDKQNKIATNLLSNNQYEIKITLKCDFNDGNGIVEKNYYKYVTTQALQVPVLNAVFLSTSTTITPKYDIVDLDNIIKINSIDILKDDTIIQNSPMSESLVFNQLLSNTVYTFKTYFSYDLNDGNGEHNDIFKSSFSTLADDVQIISHRILNDTAPKTNENVVLQLNINNMSNVMINQVKVNGIYYPVTGGDNKNNIIISIDSGNKSGIAHYIVEEMKYILNGFNVNQKVTYNEDISIEVFSRLNVLSAMSIDGMSIAKDTSGIVFEIDNPNGYEIKNIVINNGYPDDFSYSGISLDNNHYYVNSISNLNQIKYITIKSLDYINEQGEVATRRYTDAVQLPMVYVQEDPTTYAIQTNIINTPEELIAMTNGSYILGKDIDMTGYNWKPKDFAGVFDGRGHKISNLKYTFETENERASVGVFNSLNGTFKNVYIENMYFDITAKIYANCYFVVNNSATIENIVISGGVNLKAASTSFTMPAGTNIYLIEGFKVNSNSYQYNNIISLETYNSKDFKENTLGWIFNPIEYKVSNDFKYLVVNNAYIVISKYEGNSTNVVVPNFIDGLPVVAVQDFAFKNHSELKSVTLSEKTCYIGGSVFAGCSILEEIINLPLNRQLVTIFGYDTSNSLKNIKLVNTSNLLYRAFYNCSSLTSITIGNGVTIIWNDAFSGCSSLTKIIIPESVTSIGNGAFEGCSSLISITIPESVTSIGNRAFYGCSSLTSVTIPNGVTSIGDFTFEGCTNLISIDISNSVISIIEGAFYSCSSLKSIIIPETVKDIGHWVFGGCCNLITVTIDSQTIAENGAGDSNLLDYAKTIYIKDTITNIHSSITNNYTKQETSDKAGYNKYIKNV